MTDHHADQERRANAWYALLPSQAAICPRVVAEKRCLVGNARHGDSCVCRRHYHLLDHGRIWLDPEGRHVLTGEPYDAAYEEVTALLADCAALGLDVSFTGRSMWNPGATFLITIRKEVPS